MADASPLVDSRAPTRPPRADWPFWAPATDRAVSRALRLAQIRPGDRFLDLGCGDGRVLLAAARRGATVIGVDTDPELVAVTRRTLADAGVPGEVIQGDGAELDIDATVVFTYLSPATLQRLRPRFQRFAPGTRLVSVDYGVPGLVAVRVVGGVHVYDLPAPLAPAREPGWPSAGTLIAAIPECHSLASVEVVHPGGPVDVRCGGSLVEAIELEVGADTAEADEPVAIDMRWHELDSGTLVTGEVTVAGLPPHLVVGLIAETEPGMWELSERGCAGILARLARRPLPRSIGILLAAAETAG